MLKEKIDYKTLNSRQKEIYNFQKVSAIFADLGYTTIKLSDDWMGADFIAISFDGKSFLRVQLKGRATFDKKYYGKGIHVCFPDNRSGNWYLYNHDEKLEEVVHIIKESKSWSEVGAYSFPYLTKQLESIFHESALG